MTSLRPQMRRASGSSVSSAESPPSPPTPIDDACEASMALLSVPRPSKTSSFFNSSWSASPPTPSDLPKLDTSPRDGGRGRSRETRSTAWASLSPARPSTQPTLVASPAALDPSHLAPWTPQQELPAPPIRLRHPRGSAYKLGEGRHSEAYLGAFAPLLGNGARPQWTACAIKRIHADREAQLVGLAEAYILRRLQHHPAIVRLLAVMDERDGLDGAVPAVAARAGHDRSVSDTSHLAVGATTPRLGFGFASPSTPMPGSSSAPTLAGDVAGLDLPVESYFADGAVRRAVSLRVTSEREAVGVGAPQLRSVSSSSAGETSSTLVADAPRLVLVLELCPAGTLDSLFRRQPALIGRRLWLRWARSLASAVAHAHSKSVMHADIKPSNCLLTADLDVRLADWSMAIALKASPQPRLNDGIGLGTTVYCAPELVRPAGPTSDEPFGLPADIFALGVTLHVLLVGREPYATARTPVERMLWVARGAYWDWAERERLNAIGSRPASRPSSRPASVHSVSARSRSRRSSLIEPVADLSALLASDDSADSADIISRHAAALALSTASDEDDAFDYDPPALDLSAFHDLQRYSDQTPVARFLNGEAVPEGVRVLIKRMTDPDPTCRPTAPEVCRALDVF